jgi:uncharacterized membrane protein YhaH (DUF805 family)
MCILLNLTHKSYLLIYLYAFLFINSALVIRKFNDIHSKNLTELSNFMQVLYSMRRHYTKN